MFPEYYFLFATWPNVFPYTFGWTTTLQKSKIEQQRLHNRLAFVQSENKTFDIQADLKKGKR